MRILAVGGGSGGHVTPVRAVINELVKQDPNLRAYFICDRHFGDQAELIMKQAAVPVTTRRIFAGKLRRYYGVSLGRQLLDIPTVLKNLRDILLIGVGAVQSVYYILRWKPDVIFTKGGFVCLPVGIVAHLMRVPIVTHDSDMRPGLTNRVLAKWAKYIATGMPLQNYPYDKAKTSYVGVPIDEAFSPFSASEQQDAKGEWGFVDIDRSLVAVTGGGQGARRINDAVKAIAEQLAVKANVIHVTGAREYERVAKTAPDIHGYNIVPFVHDGMARLLGAADVVITRASATTLLELAGLAKPAIAIPSAVLGDQIKNARAYGEAKAVIVLEEADFTSDPTVLLSCVNDLLTDSAKRRQLSINIHSFAKPNAAFDTAALIIKAAKPGIT